MRRVDTLILLSDKLQSFQKIEIYHTAKSGYPHHICLFLNCPSQGSAVFLGSGRDSPKSFFKRAKVNKTNLLKIDKDKCLDLRQLYLQIKNYHVMLRSHRLQKFSSRAGFWPAGRRFLTPVLDSRLHRNRFEINNSTM